MSIKRTIEVELEVPIQIGKDGEFTEAKSVVLKAPAARNRQECLFLKQAFLRSVPKTSSSGATVTDEQPTGEDVILIIGSSNDVDLPELFNSAKRLFTSGVATIENMPMTNGIYDNLDLDDLQNLLGEYLINFILGSVLNNPKRLSSD